MDRLSKIVNFRKNVLAGRPIDVDEVKNLLDEYISLSIATTKMMQLVIDIMNDNPGMKDQYKNRVKTEFVDLFNMIKECNLDNARTTAGPS